MISLMIKLINKYIAPSVARITKSDWVSGMQKARLRTLPMVLVGTVIAVYQVVRMYFTDLPDLEIIQSYTFGLISLFMVYLIPMYVLEVRHSKNMRYIASCTGLALYMLMLRPLEIPAGHVYNFENFGARGMFVAVVAGLFTALVFDVLGHFTVANKIKAIPENMRESVDALLPIIIIMLTGWVFVIHLDINIYDNAVNLLMPFHDHAQSLPGVVLLYFLPTVLYSMGIYGWSFEQIIVPVTVAAIFSNANHGTSYIFTAETIIAFFNIGGRGATLGLNLLFMKSKRKRLKTLGYTSIVPSLLNMNDPLVFGAIAWNPVLMIPLWVNAFVLPIVTYFFLSLNLVPVPAMPFNLWFIPSGINAYMITGSIRAIMLVLLNLAISIEIWQPFVKIYEQQEEALQSQPGPLMPEPAVKEEV